MKAKTLIPIIAMVSVLVMFAWSYLAGSWEHSWLAVFAGGIAITAVSLIEHSKKEEKKEDRDE